MPRSSRRAALQSAYGRLPGQSRLICATLIDQPFLPVISKPAWRCAPAPMAETRPTPPPHCFPCHSEACMAQRASPPGRNLAYAVAPNVFLVIPNRPPGGGPSVALGPVRNLTVIISAAPSARHKFLSNRPQGSGLPIAQWPVRREASPCYLCRTFGQPQVSEQAPQRP